MMMMIASLAVTLVVMMLLLHVDESFLVSMILLPEYHYYPVDKVVEEEQDVDSKRGIHWYLRKLYEDIHLPGDDDDGSVVDAVVVVNAVREIKELWTRRIVLVPVRIVIAGMNFLYRYYC